MACPACDNSGCEMCEAGRITITQCPLEMITSDVIEAIHYAGLYKKGLPPIHGGALDQARQFTDACEFIWHEEKFWKSKLRID